MMGQITNICNCFVLLLCDGNIQWGRFCYCKCSVGGAINGPIDVQWANGGHFLLTASGGQCRKSGLTKPLKVMRLLFESADANTALSKNNSAIVRCRRLPALRHRDALFIFKFPWFTSWGWEEETPLAFLSHLFQVAIFRFRFHARPLGSISR